VFNPLIHTSGNYIYTVANSTCTEATAIVVVTVYEAPNAGEDISVTVCKSDGEINIFDFIPSDIVNNGIISIQETNEQLPLGVLDVSKIEENTLVLEYTLNTAGLCGVDTASITLNITTVAVPRVLEIPSFCSMDKATLEDIEVASTINYNWYESETTIDPLSLQTILKSGTYYLSNINADGCQSERTPVKVVVNDIGEGDNCNSNITDGVSPNGDGLNDSLDLSNLEEIFPDYRISIYNRYGVMVYEGRLGTNYFAGISNVASNQGNQLPAGVYYFVFEPNDGISKSFQNSFYLSR